MALHVTLIPDTFKSDGSLRPRIVHAETVAMDAVLDTMATGTALSRSDMETAVTRFCEAVVTHLSFGQQVSTPLGLFRVSVRGTYPDDEVPCVEAQNLRITLRPSRSLPTELQENTVIVIERSTGPQLPVISNVINVDSTVNPGSGSPGDILHVRG